MAKSLFRRFPTGRLTSYSLVKHTSKDAAPVLAREFFEPPTGPLVITTGLFANTATFFTPTVSQPGGGAQTLTPGLFANNPGFLTPTVTPGAVALTPGLTGNTSSFFAPTVTRGDVALAPGLVANAPTFLVATVTQPGGSTQTLTPGILANSQQFFGATVTGDVAVVASVNQFYGGGKRRVSDDEIERLVREKWEDIEASNVRDLPLTPEKSHISAERASISPPELKIIAIETKTSDLPHSPDGQGLQAQMAADAAVIQAKRNARAIAAILLMAEA